MELFLVHKMSVVMAFCFFLAGISVASEALIHEVGWIVEDIRPA